MQNRRQLRIIPTATVGRQSLAVLPVNPLQPPITIHKWSSQSEISQGTGDITGTFQWTFDDLIESTNYSALYMQYRIVEVQIFFRPMYRMNFAAEAAEYLTPLIYTAPQLINIGAWSTVQDAQRYDGVLIVDDMEPFSHRFTPVVLTGAYDGSIVAAAEPTPGPWLSTDSPDVRHYGLQWAISGGGLLATAFQVWNVNTRLTIQLRYGK